MRPALDGGQRVHFLFRPQTLVKLGTTRTATAATATAATTRFQPSASLCETKQQPSVQQLTWLSSQSICPTSPTEVNASASHLEFTTQQAV